MIAFAEGTEVKINLLFILTGQKFNNINAITDISDPIISSKAQLPRRNAFKPPAAVVVWITNEKFMLIFMLILCIIHLR